jgi:hypothetical protein
MTKRMTRVSKDKGDDKECHNNYKIQTRMTMRMKKGSQDKGNG